jgi:tripartite-type tricarboxylate transporter receptor subunit TctC
MLHDAFKKISSDPDVQSKLVSFGYQPVWISGAELSQRIASDTAKWREFIAAANLKAQ